MISYLLKKIMSRKKIFIFLLFVIIFIGWFFLFFKKEEKTPNFIFSYPQESKINFAWEKVPLSWEYFYNKERFDKEFLISSNILYQFYLYVKRYPLYIPYIEDKLKENNIPDDFKYLAIAESALRNDVVSSAWAAWIWQFMPETAKRFWLQVNDYVDERYNFEKSTDAAIAYFQKLYEIFENRTLVAAGYNRWENGILRALEDQNVSSYYDLYLNEETSRYIFRILAIKYLIESYLEQKNIVDTFIGGTYSIPETTIIDIEKIDNLSSWAENYNQNYNTIKLLNPWILGKSLPEWEWEVKVLKED